MKKHVIFLSKWQRAAFYINMFMDGTNIWKKFCNHYLIVHFPAFKKHIEWLSGLLMLPGTWAQKKFTSQSNLIVFNTAANTIYLSLWSQLKAFKHPTRPPVGTIPHSAHLWAAWILGVISMFSMCWWLLCKYWWPGRFDNYQLVALKVACFISCCLKSKKNERHPLLEGCCHSKGGTQSELYSQQYQEMCICAFCNFCPRDEVYTQLPSNSTYLLATYFKS